MTKIYKFKFKFTKKPLIQLSIELKLTADWKFIVNSNWPVNDFKLFNSVNC